MCFRTISPQITKFNVDLQTRTFHPSVALATKLHTRCGLTRIGSAVCGGLAVHPCPPGTKNEYAGGKHEQIRQQGADQGGRGHACKTYRGGQGGEGESAQAQR